MNFKYVDTAGQVHSFIGEIGKIVIYGNGNKLFERELSLETYESRPLVRSYYQLSTPSRPW